MRADPLLADELNTFYGRFKCNGGSATLPISASGSSRQSSDNHVITVSEDEVGRALKRVNVRKAAGPDGITGRVLRSCADQLAGCHGSGCLPSSSGCLCCPVRFGSSWSGQSVLIGQRECTDHELTLPHLSLISPLPYMSLLFCSSL